MSTRFKNPISPYPEWKHRTIRLSRPVTDDDIRAFLGNEELYTRDTPSGSITIIHKFGLLEINFITGNYEIEVWYDPEKIAYSSGYLDALLSTRFF
jgi:hypothetical protein